MLEFDDSWKLVTTRIPSGIVPYEKPFTSFLSPLVSVLPQALVIPQF